MFPQPACYLLANSCLNTTQAPIKIPKTKNYNSRHNGAQHYFEKLFVGMNVERIGGSSRAKQKTTEPQKTTTIHALLGSECVRANMHIHLSHLQMHVLGLGTCSYVCACVISVFSESQGPCFPCGALVLALWGGCRSCHYNRCGESSESCYLKAHQH